MKVGGSKGKIVTQATLAGQPTPNVSAASLTTIDFGHHRGKHGLNTTQLHQDNTDDNTRERDRRTDPDLANQPKSSDGFLKRTAKESADILHTWCIPVCENSLYGSPRIHDPGRAAVAPLARLASKTVVSGGIPVTTSLRM